MSVGKNDEAGGEKRSRTRYLCDDRFCYLNITHPQSQDVISVTPVNFNALGLAFFSDHFMPGSGVVKVSLAFTLGNDTLSVDGLLAELVYSRGSDIGFYCGLAFVSAQATEQPLAETLWQIEEALKAVASDTDRYGLS